MKSRILKKNKKVSTRKKYKGGAASAASANNSVRPNANTNNIAIAARAARAAMSGTEYMNHISHEPMFKQSISDIKHLNDKINVEFKKLEKVYDRYHREQTPENKRIKDKQLKSFYEILASSTMYIDAIIAQHPELAPLSPSL